MLSNVREQWFSNIRGDVLAGLVVGLALIPEAIAFSIIAGVDPESRSIRILLYCRRDFFRRRSSSYDFSSHRGYGTAHGYFGQRAWA